VTIHKIRTRATDSQGRRIVVESYNREYVEQRLVEVQKRDPSAKIVRIFNR
jgi:hypothetical protein